MRRFLPLEPELEQIIRLLHGTRICLSLMSLTASGFSPSALQVVVRAAVNPADLTGVLPDGSIGIVSLRGADPSSGAGVEGKFFSGLRTLLTTACEVRGMNEITLQFRALHRWACELGSLPEMLQSLAEIPTRPIVMTVNKHSLTVPAFVGKMYHPYSDGMREAV